MTHDNRDTLEVLKAELDFIEKGGYGRPVKTPWQPTSIFQDSPSCLNFADLERTHPCEDCLLIDFVPPEKRSEDVPCHHIPLDNVGATVEELEWRQDHFGPPSPGQPLQSVTIDELEWREDQRALEAAVKSWLRATIKRLEEQRRAEATTA